MGFILRVRDDNGNVVDIPAIKGAKGNPGPALAVSNTAAVGQTVKIAAVDEDRQPTEWEAVDMASGGGSDAGYKEFLTLVDDTLTEDTAGLTVYEYDVIGIEKSDILLIHILFPESYTAQIRIMDQSENTLTTEYPSSSKGILIGLKCMNGRYLHSAVSSSNTAARVDMPLSLFYGQLSGASGFELKKAQESITRIRLQTTSAFAAGTQIKIMRM